MYTVYNVKSLPFSQLDLVSMHTAHTSVKNALQRSRDMREEYIRILYEKPLA